MRVLVLGEAFISTASIARARVAHVTALVGEMGAILFHFGPTFGTRDQKQRERSSELSVAGSLGPADLGISRGHTGAPSEQRMRGVDSVAVVTGRKVLEVSGTQAAAASPGLRRSGSSGRREVQAPRAHVDAAEVDAAPGTPLQLPQVSRLWQGHRTALVKHTHTLSHTHLHTHTHVYPPAFPPVV